MASSEEMPQIQIINRKLKIHLRITVPLAVEDNRQAIP
jgi:hypothetical protein